MIAAIVLAAGEASRYGSPKQRLLLPSVLERLARSPVERVVVVEGAYALSDVVAAGVELVHCPDWQRGRGASLRCGLAAVGELDGAVVVLADGPNLDPRAVSRVLAHREQADIVAASWNGARGHPLWIARAAWDGIPADGLHALPALLVPCDDLEPPGDVDYPISPRRATS